MSQAAIQQEQVDSGSDLGVIVRAAELCNPFLDALGEVTLEVRGPVAASVVNWKWQYPVVPLTPKAAA